MNGDLDKKRLEEDIIYAIRAFHNYAELHPIDRNKYVTSLLDKLLFEATKMQIQETVFS